MPISDDQGWLARQRDLRSGCNADPAQRQRLRDSIAGLLGLQGVALLALLAGAAPGSAGEITATTGPLDLGTLVNGVRTCTSGPCSISGGTVAGANRFHRFDRFDASGAITGATFATGGAGTVIVGVLNGTVINRPVALSAPGALVWLSPSGISLGAGAAFTTVTNLTLTTASTLLFNSPSGVRVPFHYSDTAAAQAAGLSGTAVRGRDGLVSHPTSSGNLAVSDVILTLDASLLLDARDGDLSLSGVAITIPSTGQVELAGARVGVASSAITTGVGDLAVTADSRGLLLTNSRLQTTTGSLTLSGTVSKPVTAYAMGIEALGNSLQTSSGTIAISGMGGGPGGGGASGLRLLNSNVASQTGRIELTGHGGIDDDAINGGDGIAGADGVVISNTSLSTRGHIAIQGEAGSALATSLATARGIVIDNGSRVSAEWIGLAGSSAGQVSSASSTAYGVGIVDATTEVVGAPSMPSQTVSILATSKSAVGFLLSGATLSGNLDADVSVDSYSTTAVLLNGVLKPGGSGAVGSMNWTIKNGAVGFGPESRLLIDVIGDRFDNLGFRRSPGMPSFWPGSVRLAGALELALDVTASSSCVSGSCFIIDSAGSLTGGFASQSVALAPSSPAGLAVTGQIYPSSATGDGYLISIQPGSTPSTPPPSPPPTLTPSPGPGPTPTPAPSPPPAPTPSPTPASTPGAALAPKPMPGPSTSSEPAPAPPAPSPPAGSALLEPTIAVASSSLAPPPLTPQLSGSPTAELTVIPGPAALAPPSLARSELRLQDRSFAFGPDPGLAGSVPGVPQPGQAAGNGTTSNGPGFLPEPWPRDQTGSPGTTTSGSTTTPDGTATVAVSRTAGSASGSLTAGESRGSSGGTTTTGDAPPAPATTATATATTAPAQAAGPIPTAMASAAGSRAATAGLTPLSPQASVPATVTQIGSEETTLRFRQAEVRSQSETASRLGLRAKPPRTQEGIQTLLLRVQQAIRNSAAVR